MVYAANILRDRASLTGNHLYPQGYTDTVRGHVIRRRGRIKRYWEELLEKESQERLEELAAKIAREEVEEEVRSVKAELDSLKWAVSEAERENELSRIDVSRTQLARQKDLVAILIMIQKEYLDEQDDIQALMLLL